MYGPQTKFAKVMFLHLSVSYSVHMGGVCLSACWDTPPEQTPPQEQCMLGDTGNKRVVRILLECTLVITSVTSTLNRVVFTTLNYVKNFR